MTGRDGRSPKEDPLQLDRLLVERVKHYEPDDQLVAREFNRQQCMRDVAITRKIMSDHDRMDDHEPPEDFMRQLKILQQPPHERYDLPLTSAQEYGFYQATSAVTNDRRDIRFNFPKLHTEVTEIPDLFTRDKNYEKMLKHPG
ncbi:hypothetical protein RvY_13857 [Ramazzottius varieornatus]|uniref:Uncharacterized protein n=1 Tax=Ramazzottius varieornatus TaxID=947166 RepID=A0A1D1VWR5_RAMVA|nr:hypothetical protein RvY_13857 [Ramazzottius varieornatus]